jgi:hypothetical protein
MGIRKVFAVGVLAFAMLASGASPSFADDSGGTGGDASGKALVESADAQAQAAAKMRVAQLAQSAAKGEVGAADLRAAVASYKASFGPAAAEAFASSPRPVSVKSGYTISSVTIPADIIESLSQAPQETNYYCGPASAFQVIKAKNVLASKWNGASLTQAHLAAPPYLNTEVTASTRWQDGRMRIALNRWLFGVDSGLYVNQAKPTVSQFVTALKSDVPIGYGVQANTVETSGSYHYNGHPSNKTIGHWITAYSYTNEVASTSFADPAKSSAVSWSGSLSKYFSYATSSFTTRFLQVNGITW